MGKGLGHSIPKFPNCLPTCQCLSHGDDYDDDDGNGDGGDDDDDDDDGDALDRDPVSPDSLPSCHRGVGGLRTPVVSLHTGILWYGMVSAYRDGLTMAYDAADGETQPETLIRDARSWTTFKKKAGTGSNHLFQISWLDLQDLICV